MSEDHKELRHFLNSGDFVNANPIAIANTAKTLLADYDALRAKISKHNQAMLETCLAARDHKRCSTVGTQKKCGLCPIRYGVDAAIQTEAGDAGPPKQEQE